MDKKTLKKQRDEILQTLTNVAGLLPEAVQQDLNVQLAKLSGEILKVRDDLKKQRKPRAARSRGGR